jgi:serine/threonine protein kinase
MQGLIGQKIGRYQILRLLGKGGMSYVFVARQETINREVALKIFHDDDPARLNELLERFDREAQIMASLSHPNILKVYDYGKDDEYVFIVMEYYKGGSLARQIDISDGGMSFAEIDPILAQLADALDYAHQRGVVHRDLKPENVLLDEQGNAFITDFGIAKQLEEGTNLTRTGSILGTPTYMAPEQWTGDETTYKVDLYALGIILYEMLSGELPFTDTTPHRLLYTVMYERPISILDKRPDLPVTFQELFDRILSKNPDERHATARDLLEHFRALTQGRDPEAHMPPKPATQPASISATAPTEEFTTPNLVPGRRRFLVPLLGFAAIVIVFLLLFGLSDDNPLLAMIAPPTATPTSSPTPTLTPSPTPLPPGSVLPREAIPAPLQDSLDNLLLNRVSNETFSVYFLTTNDWEALYLATGGKPSWAGEDTSYAYDYMIFEEENFEIFARPGVGRSTEENLTDDEGRDFHASFEEGGARFAFHSDRAEGNWDVYLMERDSGEITRLTEHPGADQWPAWSPVGDQILFSSQRDGGGDFDLWILDLDGGEFQQVTVDPANEMYGAWSPDGTQIVYQSNRDGDYELYLQDLDSGEITRLTDNDWADVWPAWSPSAHLVYSSDRDGDYEIYLYDFGTGYSYQLTDNADQDQYPVWVPRG